MKRQGAERHIVDTAVKPPSNAELYQAIGREATKLGTTVSGLAEKAQDTKDASIMMESMSQAQVESMELTQQWRVQNEADPRNPNAQSDYDNEMRAVWGKYSEGLSTQGKGKWSQISQKFMGSTKSKNVVWGYTQEAKNIVSRVDNTVVNYENTAYELGMAGASIEQMDELYQNGNGSIMATQKVSGIVSDETIVETSKKFKSSIASNFITGMAVNDPDQAAELLDDKDVRAVINDPDGVKELRSYAESRKKQIEKQLNIADKTTAKNISVDYTHQMLEPETFNGEFRKWIELKEMENNKGEPLFSRAELTSMKRLATSDKSNDTFLDATTYKKLYEIQQQIGLQESNEASFVQLAQFGDGVRNAVADGKLSKVNASLWLDRVDAQMTAKLEGKELPGIQRTNSISRWFQKNIARNPIALNENQKKAVFAEMNNRLMAEITPEQKLTNEEAFSKASSIWNEVMAQQYPDIYGAGGMTNKLGSKERGTVSVSETPDDVKVDVDVKAEKEKTITFVDSKTGIHYMVSEDKRDLVEAQEGYEIVG